MCTLIVLHRCVPGRPLVVAANRDEFHARPAEGFAVRSSRTGPILSPLDLEAGGTWVGLSRRGVFAGLTNLQPQAGLTGEAAEAPRSRGEIVMAALEAESAADALRTLTERLAQDQRERGGQATYNPFQLLVADGRDAGLIVYRDGPRTIELEPGAHVVGNVESESVAARLGTVESLDREGVNGSGPVGAEDPARYPGFEDIEGLALTEEPRAMKLTRIRERVEKMVTNPGQDLFEGLARICRQHVEVEDGADEGPARSPFEATCVHVADRYGTRSSLLLELSEEPSAGRLWTTDGPPCERPYENRSSLLGDLGVRLGAR